MGLEDLLAIVLALALCAGGAFVLMALYAFWPQPWAGVWQFARALKRRYVRSNWQEFLEQISDRNDDMSSDLAAEPPPEPVRTDRGLPDTYQVRNGSTGDPANHHDPARDIISRRMASTDLITLLAVQRNGSGGYRWSKNQIAAFIGGTRGDALKLIGEARGEHQADPRFRDLDADSRPILR